MATHPILNECTRTDDGYYRHNPCEELLDSKRVTRSNWDSRFTAAGDGSVTQEIVPFCKTCGPEPSDTGAPVMY